MVKKHELFQYGAERQDCGTSLRGAPLDSVMTGRAFITYLLVDEHQIKWMPTGGYRVTYCPNKRPDQYTDIPDNISSQDDYDHYHRQIEAGNKPRYGGG